MGKNSKMVVALGGNAILQAGQKPEYGVQLENVEKSAKFLVQMIAEGNELIITHGNGPQVGNLLIQNEEAKHVTAPMPMDVLNAQTQGFIGYMMEQSINNELHVRGINKSVVNLLTRVEVLKDDPGFKNPSKPVGVFYTKEEAEKIEKEKGWTMMEDSGRGYRRVVPSPKPQKILEADTINQLAENGICVIASGGGGIPVVKCENGTYEGIEAVIDKDLVSCQMAEELKVDKLMILTDVSNVYINFGKPDQKALGETTVKEMEQYIAEGQFGKGSMGPKIEAAVGFVKRTGGVAYICSLYEAVEVLKGNGGTKIVN